MKHDDSWPKKEHRNLVAKFRNHLQSLNRSHNTVKVYINELKSFFKYINLRQIEDLGLVAWQDVESYHAWLIATDKYQESTLQVKLRCLKRFYEFLLKTGRISSNPTSVILSPRIKNRLPRTILTIKEVENLIIQPCINTDEGIKWRAILETFYSTGIRLGELCSLAIYDIDTLGEVLTVRDGKCSKDALIPIGQNACLWIRAYIQKVRHKYLIDKNESRLFIGEKGRPINSQIVERMVKAFGRQAGISKTITPHVLRHSFATHLIANGTDVVTVQKLLRHKRIDTSQIYIRVVQADVRGMQAEFHPREQHEC